VSAPESNGGWSAKESVPVILTVFPPPDAPRAQNTSEVGIELAFTENQAWHGKVKLVHITAKNQIQELATKATAAIREYSPAMIIGGSTSNAAFVLSDLAESHQIPFITPWATHPRLTEGKKFTFRVCFDDNIQAAKLAEFVFKNEGARKAIIFMNRRETFSMGVSDIFRQRFEALGGKVLETVGFTDEKEIDEAKVNSLVSLSPDVVFIPSYELETAALMTKLVSRLPKKVIYLGPDAWGGSRVLHGVLTSLKLSPRAYYVEHWSPEYRAQGNSQFLKSMKTLPLRFLNGQVTEAWLVKTENQGTSISGVALGYDAGRVALESLRLKENLKLSWIDAVKMVNFEGATGRIEFKDGPTPEKGLFIYSLEANTEKFVKAFK